MGRPGADAGLDAALPGARPHRYRLSLQEPGVAAPLPAAAGPGARRDLTTHTCTLIGVSPSDWEPSDEFILDAIQNGFSDAELRHAAYAAYSATSHSVEFNPMDEDTDLIGREDDDLILIGQQSAQRDFPNIGYRFSYKGRWLPNKERRSGPRRLRTGRGDWQAQQDGSKRSRWGGANTESHCPKYGRQDERHQLPRREAKDERAMLRYLSGEKDFWVEDTIQEEAPQSLLSVVDQLFMCYEPVTYENLWELERELENQEWEQREVLYHFHGFTDNRDQREEFTQYQLRGGPEPTRGWEPPWVKRQLTYRSRYWSFGEDRYDRYADFADCNCPACTGDDWFVMASEFAREEDNLQSLIDRFGNRDDDMGAFTGFGESDIAIDNLHIGHSSRPRFTGRYRGVSSMV